MKDLVSRGRDLLHRYTGFFSLAVIFLWIKTYIAQVTQLKLGIENPFQHFLLFLNPLAASMFFLGFSFFAKGRKKYIWLMIIYFLLSVLLYSNILYYRFFNDFITIQVLMQTQNFGEVGSSVVSLLKPYDFLFFLDFIVLVVMITTRFVKMEMNDSARQKTAVLFSLSLTIAFTNIGLAEISRPELLTRGFDKNFIVKYLGLYNYTIYDAVQSTKATAQRALANSNDVTEVLNYTKSKYAEPNPAYFGAGRGMNVIYIHLESFQNFLINYKLNGEEVTPFLNSLTTDKNTLYFDNFFHQTSHGKTSDAEFMLENSLFGLPQGSAFMTKGLNTYQAAPAILGQQGYTSAVFHGNSGSFWNRNEIYKSFGYNYFFDSSYYKMDPEDLAQYGLMDKPFFEQSIPLLESLPEPFYTKFITVSNHFPFQIDKSDATISPANTGVPTVDSYFQTARYLDEAIRQMFAYLKKSGLYDRSIIILYGDHYGISKDNDKTMEQIIGKEVTPFESTGLQRVPLFIRVPGIKGGINHEYGGQIDVLPTLLHLLGIDSKKYIQFGTDLLSKQHSQLVPFRNGDFVSPSITSVSGVYYDSTNGQPLGEDKLTEAEKDRQIVEQKLSLSDNVVNEDLLRFYTPKNFIPVNRGKYHYTNTQQ
ncbi:LTA synthase family protein [Bacillota bacterium Lsc_1132]